MRKIKYATELLQDLKRELEDDIDEIESIIADELWTEDWSRASMWDKDSTGEDREEYYRESEQDYKDELSKARATLKEVNRELAIISSIKRN